MYPADSCTVSYWLHCNSIALYPVLTAVPKCCAPHNFSLVKYKLSPPPVVMEWIPEETVFLCQGNKGRSFHLFDMHEYV